MDKNLKIIVFGIDRYTEFVIKSICLSNQIIGVSDSYSSFDGWGSYSFIRASEIINQKFDYIVITARERGIRDEIISDLEERGVSRKNIVSFFEIFHEDKVDKLFKKSPGREHDGVILGLSHAAKGLNPTYLSGCWCNLATSAEDIYYHFEVIKKYSRFIKNKEKLKNVVIDLYDYTVFEFDTSLSAQALSYWADGGNASIHNYYNNSVFGNDIERDMAAYLPNYPAYYPNRKKRELDIRRELFNEEYVYSNIDTCFMDLDPSHLGYDDFPCAFQNKGHIDRKPMIPADVYTRLNKLDCTYAKTEDENRHFFEEMMNYILKEFPNARVVLMLMPRYGLIEEFHERNEYMLGQKKKFEEYILRFVSDRVSYLNYKNLKKISMNHYLWRDPSHLNYQGSVVMSTVLENDLRKMKG